MKVMPFAGALAMFAALAGCTQESTPGGPGVSNTPKQVTKTETTKRTDENGATRREVATTREAQKPVVTDKAETFTLHTPMMSTTLDTGKKRDVDISISRGKQFTQSVKLEFKAPPGVTITPAMATIPAGQDKVTVSLEATKEAPAGKQQIQVTAIPETGHSVSLDIPVEVKHAS